ncbi:MAG: hypothetical protein IKF90_15975 [Parasporobacterium sp.]|nr:hypothetical protein [Parasporobacterium sp.]
MARALDTTELEAQQQNGEVTTFSEKLWCGLLDYATAYADGRLTFTFRNGSTIEG